MKSYGRETFRDLTAVYATKEELGQCYHQQLPRICNAFCVSCSPDTDRILSASSCSAPGRGGRHEPRAISIYWSLASTSPEAVLTGIGTCSRQSKRSRR